MSGLISFRHTLGTDGKGNRGLPLLPGKLCLLVLCQPAYVSVALLCCGRLTNCRHS